jgi:hypothetical protein
VKGFPVTRRVRRFICDVAIVDVNDLIRRFSRLRAVDFRVALAGITDLT